jgi:Family of unknown function (DUF6518)
VTQIDTTPKTRLNRSRLSAYWARTDRGAPRRGGYRSDERHLDREGLYGLSTIADTTYPPYWPGEIVVGVVILALVAVQRPTQVRRVAVAVACSLLVAAAFVAVYRLSLISIFAARLRRPAPWALGAS